MASLARATITYIQTAEAFPRGVARRGQGCIRVDGRERAVRPDHPATAGQQARRARSQTHVCAHRAWPDASELSEPRRQLRHSYRSETPDYDGPPS